MVAKYALPYLCPFSLAECVDNVYDTIDAHLLGGDGLVLLRLGLFEEAGFLRSYLWVHCESSLPHSDDFRGWAPYQASLHRVFLRLGHVVGSAIREVSVDVLDFSDLWLHWECDHLHTVDSDGVENLPLKHAAPS